MTCADLSQDGSLLLTGTKDGNVNLWDVTLQMALRHIQSHSGPVNAVIFSPGRCIVILIILPAVDIEKLIKAQIKASCVKCLKNRKRKQLHMAFSCCISNIDVIYYVMCSVYMYM